MSKLPMDLSKFRKVASDKDTSTFRHYEGHEIKVAHSKLSSKMRSTLDQMPLHKPKKKEQRFADGGQVEDAESPDPFGSPVEVASADPESQDTPRGASASWDEPEIQSGGYQPAQEDPGLAAEQGPATAGAPAGSDPYGAVGALQSQLAANQKIGAGQQAEAQAVGAQGAQNIAQEQAYQQGLQEDAHRYQEAVAPVIKERQDLVADINNRHIDPKHYVDNMSTGSKISTAIGLILGGMGSGLTHGPNLAFNMLQDNINKDVEAQRSELGKKQNLLAHNLQQTRDLRSAYDLTRVQSNDMLASHLRMTADQTADPIAKARLLQIAGMTDQKTAEIQHQIAMQRMAAGALSGQSGTNPIMAIKMLAPAAQQPALMKDLKAKQDTDANIENMLGAFDRTASSNTILNKLNPQAQSRMDADWDPKMVKLAHESAGRFNMEELPIMNKYKPKATDTATTIAAKRRDFESDLRSKANFPSLEPYGVRAGSPQQSAGNFGFKPRSASGK